MNQKAGTVRLVALASDGAAMSGDGGFDDGHPQPGSFIPLSGNKRIENSFKVFRGDAGTVILEGNGKVFVTLCRADLDCAIAVHRFDAVFNQVGGFMAQRS